MISQKQLEAIEKMFFLGSWAKVAKEMNISRKTLWSWSIKEDFQKTLEDTRKNIEKAFQRKMTRMALDALDSIDVAILAKKDVSAALKFVELFLKMKNSEDMKDIKERIEKLENSPIGLEAQRVAALPKKPEDALTEEIPDVVEDDEATLNPTDESIQKDLEKQRVLVSC